MRKNGPRLRGPEVIKQCNKTESSVYQTARSHFGWPSRIAKPFTSETPCSTLDIYPTVLEATGVAAQSQIQPLDGVSLIPLLDHETETRSKPYKLHTNASGKSSKKGKKASADAADSLTLLFDVSKHPMETTDLAAQQPERVLQMNTALEAWKASVENSLSGAEYESTP